MASADSPARRPPMTGCRSVAPSCPHCRQRAPRRRTSLEASLPHRMTGAASAIGAACRQSAFAHCSHIHRVPRCSLPSVGIGGSGPTGAAIHGIAKIHRLNRSGRSSASSPVCPTARPTLDTVQRFLRRNYHDATTDWWQRRRGASPLFALYLAGPESDFFVGQTIPFAGGWAA